MARRKFRNAPRFEASEDRSIHEFFGTQTAAQTSRSELLRLIRGGEDTYLELKVKLSNPEKITQGIVALANTAGGTMIFGVSDQLRIEGVSDAEGVRDELKRICREEIVPPLVPQIDIVAFDSGRRIVAIDIDGRRRPYRTRDGRFYMRLGAEKREVAREQLSEWLDEIRPLGFENVPLQGVVEEDFDDGLLWTFAKAFDFDGPNQNLYQTADFLKKDLLLAVGTQDDFFPTVAGFMLFGRSDRLNDLLSRTKLTVTRFSGDGDHLQTVETKEVAGNMLFQLESTMRFIERYCDLVKDRPKTRRDGTDVKPFHIRGVYNAHAVREAVGNLLMHRDLAFRDIPTRINIYDSSIEFINARRTNGFVPPASRAIRYGVTQRINPQLSAVFTRREYGSALPQGGLPMILKLSEQFAGKRAEIYTSNDEFKLKLFSATA